MSVPEPDPVKARSESLFRLFGAYLRLRFIGNFRAIRVSGMSVDLPAGRPVIMFSNHPSWWDPALYMLLANQMFPGRPGFGPMDAPALARYGFFRKLGIFGIEKTTRAGARRFLEVSRHVLAGRGTAGRAMLWVTAEGDFTDPRTRPVALRPGIAHLARAVPDALLVPLAIEYVFWNESKPELLLRFGAPLFADATLPPAEWTRLLQDALAVEMDALAADAISREPARFQLLVRGSVGSSFFYDLYRRARATVSGARFSREHEGKV